MERDTPTKLFASLALVLVALAAGGVSMIQSMPDGPCFAAGPTAYRMAASAWSPDFRVRIGGPASTDDLRIRLVGDAESADVVMVDDADDGGRDACAGAAALKTVQIVANEQPGVVKVTLVPDEPADLRLFVRSWRFTAEDSAALVAAMMGSRTRDVAQIH